MTLIQLNPPMDVTCPKGDGIAYFLDTQGTEQQPLWGVVCDDGQFWFFPNQQIRFHRNFSMNRPNPEVVSVDPTYDRYKINGTDL